MIYAELPSRILVNQGSYFGNAFANMGEPFSDEIQKNGIEAHPSLVLGERYHQPLRYNY